MTAPAYNFEEFVPKRKFRTADDELPDHNMRRRRHNEQELLHDMLVTYGVREDQTTMWMCAALVWKREGLAKAMAFVERVAMGLS